MDLISEFAMYHEKQFLQLVSKNIKKYRLKNKYSQLKLAIEIGYNSVSYYSKMESIHQEEHFNLSQIYKISQVLNIDPSDLFKDENWQDFEFNKFRIEY